MIGLGCAVVGLVISGRFFLGPMVLGAKGSTSRHLPAWLLIMIDAALALSIILAVGADSAPSRGLRWSFR